MIKATAAKIIGRSHKLSNTECQDAVKTRNLRSIACIALADGAGSKQSSKIGANSTVQIATHIFIEKFDEFHTGILQRDSRLAKTIIDHCLLPLKEKAVGEKCSLSNYASTFLFFACDNNRYIAGHIGDGAIIARFGNECNLLTLSEPENGEYANTTFFLTDTDAPLHLRLYAGDYEDTLGVCLMSDGTAESLFSKSSGQASVGVSRLLDIFLEVPTVKMKRILQSNLENILSARTGDDCSIAALVVQPKGSKKIELSVNQEE